MNRYTRNERPWFIYWELTRGCDLACKHCRAEAVKYRHPLELTFEECKDFVDSIKDFGEPYPHLIVTGGDPLKRPDFFDILAYARYTGLTVSVAPSATYSLDRFTMQKMQDLGISAISLSLDGATPESHDAFRGEPHCFEWTANAAKLANEIGIPLQFNTLVCAETLPELEEIYETIRQYEVLRWSVFFLVPTGRGQILKSMSPYQTEETLNWLYDKMKETPFPIKTTEAHHFRRIAIQRMQEAGFSEEQIANSPMSRGFGIRDGNGIMFISHTGEVMPSGFLPEKAGNVRTDSLADLYRHSELFTSIRDVDAYKGKCGYCEFRDVCGGSRARAYAFTGNAMGSDPLCAYKPEMKTEPEKGIAREPAFEEEEGN